VKATRSGASAVLVVPSLSCWKSGVFLGSHFRDDTRARCVLAAPAAHAARGSRNRRPAHSIHGAFPRPRSRQPQPPGALAVAPAAERTRGLPRALDHSTSCRIFFAGSRRATLASISAATWSGLSVLPRVSSSQHGPMFDHWHM
jgi:hypothetical protein